MMRAFGEGGRAAAAKAGRAAPKLIAVTVLTSLDAAALSAIGLAGSPREAAVRLAVLAKASGLDGVVCSPDEIEAIRSACGEDFFLVVPGVRPAGADPGDQKRVATPADAIRSGARSPRRRPADHRCARSRGGRSRDRGRDRRSALILNVSV